MPVMLRFSSRTYDTSLPGAIFPVSRAVFDDIVERGNKYVVHSDAASFTKLKRLDNQSCLFFLVDDSTDTATLHGRFRLASRPELDSDPTGENYLATVTPDVSETHLQKLFANVVPCGSLRAAEGDHQSHIACRVSAALHIGGGIRQ